MCNRRQALITLPPLLLPAGSVASPSLQQAMKQARAMRDEARRGGDQGDGAVVLRGDQVVGQAPSRVVAAGAPS